MYTSRYKNLLQVLQTVNCIIQSMLIENIIKSGQVHVRLIYMIHISYIWSTQSTYSIFFHSVVILSDRLTHTHHLLLLFNGICFLLHTIRPGMTVCITIYVVAGANINIMLLFIYPRYYVYYDNFNLF